MKNGPFTRYFQNLALPGLYTPSTYPADTPMTSDTSVSTQSSSDLVTPDDDLLKRRHHQQLITPTSSDLATPDDDMPKSCLRRQQVTPTSSDLATPEEDIMKTCKLRKHQHVLGKLSWDDQPVDSREKVVSAGALLTSLKSAALADPSMLWLPLQRPRSLNLQLRGNTTSQQVAALAAVTASKCCQHRHSRPLIGKLYIGELQMYLCKFPFTHFFQGVSFILEGKCRWLRINIYFLLPHSSGY